jgi:hypothetical protein
MIRNLCLTAAIVFAFAVPSTASAYWPWGYGVYGYGVNWGFNQTTDYIPAPPYFAVHPPIYYAPHITARHYGASPFAWGPGMQPITYVDHVNVAVAKTQPVMLVNSYVKDDRTIATSAQAAATDEVQPLKISNPFVARTGR